MLVVAAGRTATYDPVTDTWQRLRDPPGGSRGYSITGASAWTGTELVLLRDLGSGSGRVAFDPARDRWRHLPPAPVTGTAVAATWTGSEVVVITGELDSAAYDPATECWRLLGAVPLPGPASVPGQDVEAWEPHHLVWTGSEVVAMGARDGTATSNLPVATLDPASGTWEAHADSPLGAAAGGAVWIGDRLLFLSPRGRAAGATVDGTYDPATDSWQVLDTTCGPDTTDAFWTGKVVLSAYAAMDPATGACYTLPDDHDRNRSGFVDIWTGRSLVRWSGSEGEETPSLPDGIAYRPPDWARP